MQLNQPHGMHKLILIKLPIPIFIRLVPDPRQLRPRQPALLEHHGRLDARQVRLAAPLGVELALVARADGDRHGGLGLTREHWWWWWPWW